MMPNEVCVRSRLHGARLVVAIFKFGGGDIGIELVNGDGLGQGDVCNGIHGRSPRMRGSHLPRRGTHLIHTPPQI